MQMLPLAYAYLMGYDHYVIEIRQTDEYSRWFDGLRDRKLIPHSRSNPPHVSRQSW